MNDAERDAWLREALRHAPDSSALPPRDISEAILAEARAIARRKHAAPPNAARAASRHRLAALWDWLARPPVAAGFASLMAATLVGLMWWDQPIDETLPRRPDAVDEHAKSTPASGAGATASVATPVPFDKKGPGATAATNATAAAEARAAAAGAQADKTAPTRRLPAGRDDVARSSGEVAQQAANGKDKVEDVLAKKSASRAEQKEAKPSPFPTTDSERAATTPAPEFAAGKDREAAIGRAADPAAPSGATPAAKSVVEPAARPGPAEETSRARAQPEPATSPAMRRSAKQEDARSPAANDRELDAAKRTPAAAPGRLQSPAPAPAVLSGALADAPERQASASAAQAVGAQTLNKLAITPRADGSANAAPRADVSAAAAPLAAIVGTFTRTPAQWSRASADGSAVALEAGWRDWLTELDAAASGRWQRIDLAAERDHDRDSATILRLLAAGRPDAVVRLDGTTARIDGAGERWQATLPLAAAERLRSAAERLPR
ncbi:MAG TPA: hypothetical protein VH041_06460 [Caldimonas sp.]|nr:hypothetical protein [Caldimonas sp.]HEX4233931.1 hypothetical protein [Caldimonas sp.]